MLLQTLIKLFIILIVINSIQVTKIKLILFSFKLIIFQYLQLQKRRYNLVFYEYLCTPHSSVIKIFDCDFRKLRMNHYTFSENLMFGKNMAKGFNVRVYVDVNQWGGKKGIHFINVKMDACEAIKMVFENQVLSTLLVELRRTSNVPYLCPFKGTLHNQRFNLEFYEYICTIISNKDIKKFECNFNKLNENHYVFNEHLMFSKNMASGFNVRVYVDVNQLNSRHVVKVFDIRLEACQALNSTYGNKIYKFLFDELRRTSNIPYKCPFKGNFLYKFQNFSFTDKFLPSFTPLLNFTFGLDFYEYQNLLATTKITGATKSKIVSKNN
ncbi:hypothetical protein CVS40_10630 [Lucilia cuprina]|nr:hypothetical protein CVS40_10630 [Lucilia cuprina]